MISKLERIDELADLGRGLGNRLGRVINASAVACDAVGACGCDFDRSRRCGDTQYAFDDGHGDVFL